MQRIIIFLILLFSGAHVYADGRGILIEVTSMREVRPGLIEYTSPKVNVYSEAVQERKQDVSLAEAAGILKQARGWKSLAFVVIVFHHDFIKPTDLITLLEGMKDNADLMLLHVGPADGGAGKEWLEKFKQLRPKT
jgi:hypothetical protein